MTSKKKKIASLSTCRVHSLERITLFLALDGVDGAGGGEESDSFNSVTCFCGKPFAGRPMIECSGCLLWLHMSCAKVKRKNIPEFYYCEGCKGSGGLLSLMGTSTASSGEEGTPNRTPSGTLSSNSIITEGGLYMSHQNRNLSMASTKPKNPKLIKKSSSTSLMSSSDNIQNNGSDQLTYRKKSSSSSLNGKLKKKQRSPKIASPVSSSAAASLTELSLNHQVSSTLDVTTMSNGATNLHLNNNNIFLESTQGDIADWLS